MENPSLLFHKAKFNLVFCISFYSLFLVLLWGVTGLPAAVHSPSEENLTWVNWQDYTIGATGTGFPDTTLPYPEQKEYALKEARRKAVDLLFDTLKILNLTSNETVGDTLAVDSLLTYKVKRVVEKAKKADTRYMSDLSVETDVQLSLTEGLLGLLLPPTGGGKPVPMDTLHCPLCGAPWPPNKPFPKYLFSLSALGGRKYTGLVVDAQGLGAQPALAPQILDEQKRQIYGVKFVTREIAASRGVVKYLRSLKKATQDDRVGKNPLVVKALFVTGKNRTDLVIPNATAILLHYTPNNIDFLHQARVIIVLDED